MSDAWNKIQKSLDLPQESFSLWLDVPCIVMNEDGNLFENILERILNYIYIPSTITDKYLYLHLSIADEIGTEAANKRLLKEKLKGQEFLK